MEPRSVKDGHPPTLACGRSFALKRKATRSVGYLRQTENPSSYSAAAGLREFESVNHFTLENREGERLGPFRAAGPGVRFSPWVDRESASWRHLYGTLENLGIWRLSPHLLSAVSVKHFRPER